MEISPVNNKTIYGKAFFIEDEGNYDMYSYGTKVATFDGFGNLVSISDYFMDTDLETFQNSSKTAQNKLISATATTWLHMRNYANIRKADVLEWFMEKA
jgi:hypothetical protein